MAATLSTLAIKMLMSLLTENFLESLVYHALKYAASKSTNSIDDQLVEDVRKAWGINA